MSKNPLTVKEVERGQILRFLGEVGLQAATWLSILHDLDYEGYTVNADDLNFHLRYLAEKGFVELDWFPKVTGEESKIRTVKITTAGLDLLDRREKGETGVRF